jgi:sugar lactone lactonase YvrE
VVHDAARDVLYVSNFDVDYARRTEPSGFISRLAPDGEVLAPRWVNGLEAPCGLALHEDRLYVAERHHVAVIDVATGAVVTRHALPEARFPNDVAVDDAGRIYVSDSRPNPDGTTVSVWRIVEGEASVWLADPAVGRANGLCLNEGELLVGCSADGCLVAVDLETRAVRRVASLGAGIVDGIRPDGRGGVLVSLWQGQVFQVGPDGQPVELLDLMGTARNAADFWYLPASGRLLVPTFLANTVAAYRLDL